MEAVLTALRDEGQEHVLALLEGAGPAEDKERLREQLRRLDVQCAGGLQNYLRTARELLAASKRGENSFLGFTPQVPDLVEFDFSSTSQQIVDAEERGRVEVAAGRCAFVLVAGGLGERLGYSGIKAELPCEITTNTCYLHLFCEHILALANGADAPLAIMTSDDTHEKTQALLEKEEYFGLKKSNVNLLKQEKVPSLMDDEPRLALDPKDPFRILTKPHGHGDVHRLLLDSGLAESWVAEGKKWLFFFQDTNPMTFRTMPAALGVSAMRNLPMNSIAIPRKAKSAAGAIMKLVHEDGSKLTVNVEYNLVDSLLRSTISPDEGDVNGPNGYSQFPGNMNQLIFALKPYFESLKETAGMVPEFVNPKYVDDSRTAFKSPTRLECMMQDYPLAMRKTTSSRDLERIGVTVYMDSTVETKLRSLTHRLYAPAKNNIFEGAAKSVKGIPDATCTSSELAIYACNCLMLKDLGCKVDGPQNSNYGGIEQPEWPHVVLKPRFCPLFSILKEHIRKPFDVWISQNSTLVVDGKNIFFEGPVHLDGILVILAVDDAVVRLSSVSVQTKPLRPFVEVDPGDKNESEIHRIRGFKARRQEQEPVVVEFTEPGEFTREIRVIQIEN